MRLYYNLYKKLPNQKSGAIKVGFLEGNTWNSLNAALQFGRRGLVGSTNLAELKKEYKDYITGKTDELVIAAEPSAPPAAKPNAKKRAPAPSP